MWLVTLGERDPAAWTQVLDQATGAERAGIDRIALTGEHVVLGEDLSAYSDPSVGGTPGSTHATGPDGSFLEPFVTMAMIAARTSRVRVTSGILLAALRRPIVLAKSAATLDVLSGGRLDLGVGVGWHRREYEAAGLDFERRGRLLDETLATCHALWRDSSALITAGDRVIDSVHMMPKPLQAGGVPVWIAGAVRRPVMRRLARFGAGWIPWGPAGQDLDALVAEIPRMRDAVAAEGRDPEEIGVVAGIPVVTDRTGSPVVADTMARVPELVANGVTDIRLKASLSPTGTATEDFLAPLVQGFHEIAGRGASSSR